MAAETERIGRLENRVDTLTEQTSELRGAYENLATKSDVDKATLKIVLWILIGAAVLQGIIAALGAIYILDQIGPVLMADISKGIEQFMEALFTGGEQ